MRLCAPVTATGLVRVAATSLGVARGEVPRGGIGLGCVAMVLTSVPSVCGVRRVEFGVWSSVCGVGCQGWVSGVGLRCRWLSSCSGSGPLSRGTKKPSRPGWTKRVRARLRRTFASASALPKYEDESHVPNSGHRRQDCQQPGPRIPPFGLVGSVTCPRDDGADALLSTAPPTTAPPRCARYRSSSTALLGAAAPAAPARDGRAAGRRRPLRR